MADGWCWFCLFHYLNFGVSILPLLRVENKEKKEESVLLRAPSSSSFSIDHWLRWPLFHLSARCVHGAACFVGLGEGWLSLVGGCTHTTHIQYKCMWFYLHSLSEFSYSHPYHQSWHEVSSPLCSKNADNCKTTPRPLKSGLETGLKYHNIAKLGVGDFCVSYCICNMFFQMV